MGEPRQKPLKGRTARRRARKAEAAGQPSGLADAAEQRAAGTDLTPESDGHVERAGGPEQTPPTAQAAQPTAFDPRSMVFDPVWYLSQYADVASAKADPAQHFLENGWLEGRDPNPYFSTRFYCERNPDVVGSGLNPFLHYVMHGAREGRAPRPQD